jgi:hypothetical protein
MVRRCPTPYRKGRCTCEQREIHCIGCGVTQRVRVCRLSDADYYTCNRCDRTFVHPQLEGCIHGVTLSAAGCLTGHTWRIPDAEDQVVIERLRAVLRACEDEATVDGAK